MWNGIGIGIGRQVVFGGGGFDPDAQAFIDAAGITDATEHQAINNLVQGIKSENIWDKMSVIYPLVGGSADTCKWNLKDPRDADDAYRISFSTGWSFTNGADGDGVGYADTHFNLNASHPDAVFDIGIYFTEVIDSFENLWGSIDEFQFPNNTTSFYYYSGFAPVGGNQNGSAYFPQYSAPGMATWSNRGNSSKVVFYEDEPIDPGGMYLSASNLDFYLGAANANGSPNYNHAMNHAFFYFASGLADQEIVNLHGLINSFQTELGRNA
jgi:hypothetical protein